MADAVEAVIELPIQILDPHPRNVRRGLGGLLMRSIRDPRSRAPAGRAAG